MPELRHQSTASERTTSRLFGGRIVRIQLQPVTVIFGATRRFLHCGSLGRFFAAAKTEPTETPSFRAITRQETPAFRMDLICSASIDFLGLPSFLPFARACRRPARTLSTI